MATQWGFKANPYVKYDGTNAEEIRSAMEDHNPGWTATIISETGGILTIDRSMMNMPTDRYEIEEDMYFGVWSGEQITQAVWDEKYVKVA